MTDDLNEERGIEADHSRFSLIKTMKIINEDKTDPEDGAAEAQSVRFMGKVMISNEVKPLS